VSQFGGKGNMHSDNVILEKRVSHIIIDMAQNGITLSLEKVRILKQKHGIEIAPHILAEFKYHKRKGRLNIGNKGIVLGKDINK
jgi:hypothetical protein